MDINAYFNRIGYNASCAPTLENLHALTYAHAKSIPFENLDVLLGQPIRLSSLTRGKTSAISKIVSSWRGQMKMDHVSAYLTMG